MAGKGFDDADDQAPLYLRTTEEMLGRNFLILEEKKQRKLSLKIPIKLLIWWKKSLPFTRENVRLFIENSNAMLREICYNKAHEIYGEELRKW